MTREIIKNVRELIAAAQTLQAIDLIKETYHDANSEIKDDITLLESIYSSNERDKLLGTKDNDQYQITLNKLNRAILYYIQEDFNNSKGFFDSPKVFFYHEALLSKIQTIKGSKKIRFEAIFDPLNDSIIVVHRDYQKMFEKVIRLLPNTLDDGRIIIDRYKENGKYDSILDITNNKEEYLRSIELAKKILEKDRLENDFVRVQSRAYAQKLLKDAGSREEKRFCWAILCYFLSRTTPLTDQVFTDMKIEGIIKEGADQHTDTPSYLVRYEILQSKDANYIREEIRSIITNLNSKFIDICSHYLELKLSII